MDFTRKSLRVSASNPQLKHISANIHNSYAVAKLLIDEINKPNSLVTEEGSVSSRRSYHMSSRAALKEICKVKNVDVCKAFLM